MDRAGKLLAILMTAGEAFAYIYTGQYGNCDDLGMANIMILFTQLMLSGLMCILLDDLLSSGYGFGSGISLFITVNVCENIFWKLFSPITLNTQKGTEFQGALIGFVHNMISKDDKWMALKDSFFRTSAPNLSSLVATIFMSILIIYLQGFEVQLPLGNIHQRGISQAYPIKLFYNSSMPLILQASLTSNLYFMSKILYLRFSNNIIVKLIGQWQQSNRGYDDYEPVGGFAYYIAPVDSF